MHLKRCIKLEVGKHLLFAGVFLMHSMPEVIMEHEYVPNRIPQIWHETNLAGT